jgi:hypothetical protein
MTRNYDIKVIEMQRGELPIYGSHIPIGDGKFKSECIAVFKIKPKYGVWKTYYGDALICPYKPNQTQH